MKGWTEEAIRRLQHNHPKLLPTSKLVPSIGRWMVGIDSGVHTGYAIWDREERKFLCIQTMSITQAIFRINDFWSMQITRREGLFLRIEDARLRKHIPWKATEKGERGRREGAGSVKRDAKIWEDFCIEKGIPYEMVAPKDNVTKLSITEFGALTKYLGKTSEHARDAAMLVCGF